MDLSNHSGFEAFSCLQPLYNLLDRQTEFELLPVCLNEGVGIIPWSPLRGGWLSGKFRRGMEAPPAQTRVEQASREGWSESWQEYATERTWNVLDELFRAAEGTGRHPAQVALRWLLQMPGVTAPIIGARNMQQLKTNLGASGWSLSEEQMDRLNKVSDIDPGYPVRFVRNGYRR